MKSLKDYYSVRAAAGAIGIEYMTLHQRIHRGQVKVDRPAPRVVLVHRSEVERLKKEREGASC